MIKIYFFIFVSLLSFFLVSSTPRSLSDTKNLNSLDLILNLTLNNATLSNYSFFQSKGFFPNLGFPTNDSSSENNSTIIIDQNLIWNISYQNTSNLLYFHHIKNEYLIFGDDSGLINICNISNGNIIKTYNDGYQRSVTAMIQITNTSLIAFGSGKDIIVWDVEINTLYRNLSGHTSNITSLAYNLETDRMISGSLDGFIRVWDISCCSKQSLYISINGVLSLDYIEGTTNLIVLAFNDENIQIWDLKSGTLLKCFDGNQKIVRKIINILNTPYFLSSGSDNTTYLRNKYTYLTIKIYQFDQQVLGLSYEPNMRLMLISSEKFLNILEIDNLNISFVSKENFTITQGILFYPDSLEGVYNKNNSVSYSILIDSSSTNIQAYNLTFSCGNNTNENQTNHSSLLQLINETQKINDQGDILSYAYSNSLKYTITGDSKGYVKIWNATQGNMIRAYKTNSDRVSAIRVLTPDNLIAFSETNKINIFDLNFFLILYSLNDHSDNITTLSYITESNRLISGSMDGTVKIWNGSNFAVETTIYAFIGGISHVIFNNEMNSLICAGFNNSEISVYRLSGEKDNNFTHNVQSVTQLLSLEKKGFAYIGLSQEIYIYEIAVKRFKSLEFDYTPNCLTFDSFHNSLIISTINQIFIYNLTDYTMNSVLNESFTFKYISSSFEVIEDSTMRYNTIIIEETENSLKFWNVSYNDSKPNVSNGSNYYLNYYNSFQLSSSADFLLYIDNGDTLIVGNTIGSLIYIQTKEGKVLHNTSTPTAALSNLILASNNGSLVAVASLQYAYVYNTNNYELYDRAACGLNVVTALDYDSERNYLIIGDASGEIYFWDITSKVCINETFKAHDNGVSHLSYLGNQKLLSSGYLDNTVKLWNLNNNLLVNSYVGPQGAAIIGRSLAQGDNSALINYVPSNNWIMTTGFGKIYIWDKNNVTIFKKIMVNETIKSLRSINNKETTVVSTANSLYFLSHKDFNFSLIINDNKSQLNSFEVYKNITDGQNYLVEAKNDSSINIFNIAHFNNEETHSDSQGDDDESKAWIAGVVIGALAAIIIIGLIIYCIIKKNRKKKENNDGYKQFNEPHQENET